jgi:hypothetical protein
VIFGYFYTVKPAFQLQLLQEQTAHLQVTNEVAAKKLESTIAAQSEAAAKLAAVTADFARIERTRDELAAQLRQEVTREGEAQRGFPASSRYPRKLEICSSHNADFFIHGFLAPVSSVATVRAHTPRWTMRMVISLPKRRNHGLTLSWKSLGSSINSKRTMPNITNIRRNFRSSMLPLLAEGAELKCDAVDLDQWSAYSEEYSHWMGANKQGDAELEKQLRDARAQHKQLVGVEEARPRFRASARVGLLFRLQRNTARKWAD